MSTHDQAARRIGWVRRAALTLLLVFTFGAGIAVDRVVWEGGTGAGASSSLTDLPEFQTLQQTWDLIHDNYVDVEAIDNRTLLYGAARGMVEALGDTGHSTFLDPDQARAFEASSRGELIGIGVQLDFSTGRPIVVTPVDGSPADRAGIKARDVIVAIDGKPTERMSPARVAQLLRGDVGTTVTLTVERPESGVTFVVTLMRERIKLDPVSWSMLPDRVALIRLSEFSVGATDGVKDALKRVKARGARALILDLRDNPGGLVFEAIGVASQFMPEGTPIYLYQDREGPARPVRTVGTGLGLDLPMAVLVNGGSASSAEIVGVALRDSGRAVLIGERTFGTGTVLMPYQLDDGSILLLGTAFWLTPNGEQIWRRGVEPDLTVELPASAAPHRPGADRRVSAEEFAAIEDAQLQRAFDEVTTLLADAA